MEISPVIIERILLPFAILENRFIDSHQPRSPRLESLRSPQGPQIRETWSIDGGEPAYLRFFAIPHFARAKPPLQVCIVVPLDQMVIPSSLVHSLQLNRVFPSAKTDLPGLPLTKHLIRGLSSWSSEYPDFEETYLSLPYGSRIIVESLHEDVHRMRIHCCPSYELEQRWLSVRSFEAQTGLNLSNFVKLIDWAQLELESQLHDSISVVRVPSLMGSQLMVYKAVTEDVQYMYHELRTFLTMKEHPTIIPRPRYVVLKQCRFGGKIGICGFILEYHPHGNLQNALQSRHVIPLRQKLYWAQRLTAALIHIRDHGPGFYSDLKPNNILLRRKTGDDLPTPLLIDFEQRGSWYDWSPPEVQYLEYLDILATKAPSRSVRTTYSEILQNCIPGWSSEYRRRPLNMAPEGYSLGWTALSISERQRGQLFCLGKLLWCIFEQLPSCNTFLTLETLAEGINQGQCFPEFQHTPLDLRGIISRCTANALEWNDDKFPVRRKADLLISDGIANNLEETPHSKAIQELARKWWRKRVNLAVEFVINAKKENIDNGHEVTAGDQTIVAAPTLEEVMDAVTRLLDTVI